MSIDVIIAIAAILISIAVFLWLINVIKATVKTALTVAIVLLAVQLLFGVGPQDLWQYSVEWLRTITAGSSNS